MALFPEVERKAQEEIDIAVGGDRLPQFTDRDALPYVECVLQETMRWHGAFPIGVPHRSLEDDVYNGMLILKGSIVFADPLAMSRDESVYKDAWTYYPDRVRHSIGTGRAHTMSRICPGRYLADASVRIAIASILATLSITRELREDGREIIAEAISAPSITSHPKPYPCVIKPRSVKAEALIMQMKREALPIYHPLASTPAVFSVIREVEGGARDVLWSRYTSS